MQEEMPFKCNVNLRKLLSDHKSHVRETNLFTGAIPNQVRNSQTSRFVAVPGQNPERSSRGDSAGVRFQSVMAGVCFCRSCLGYRVRSRNNYSQNWRTLKWEEDN